MITTMNNSGKPRIRGLSNSGLQLAALVFCWIRAQRQPWLRDNYTADAGSSVIG
jgi:hypothetical protein